MLVPIGASTIKKPSVTRTDRFANNLCGCVSNRNDLAYPTRRCPSRSAIEEADDVAAASTSKELREIASTLTTSFPFSNFRATQTLVHTTLRICSDGCGLSYFVLFFAVTCSGLVNSEQSVSSLNEPFFNEIWRFPLFDRSFLKEKSLLFLRFSWTLPLKQSLWPLCQLASPVYF